MEKFKYLDHTADLKFQAFGKTLEDAFGNAVYAMMQFLLPDQQVKLKVKKKILITAPRRDTLLYSFLEEFIVLMETKHFLPGKISKLVIREGGKEGNTGKEGKARKDGKAGTEGSARKEWSLTAEIAGDSYDEYETKGDIKAITYSDMLIEKKEGVWMVQVVVDI